MAADVGYLVRVMNGYNNNNNKEEQQQGKSTALITRDLLGGCCSAVDSKELDLDVPVPDGYENRLDLKTGKMYLQRCNSPKKSASPSEHKKKTNETVSNIQDLNFPPVSKQPLLSLFDDTNLDLKLIHSTPPSSKYESVCTLEKVKFALERAEKQTIRKRSISMSQSSSQSNSSSSLKETAADLVNTEEKSSSSFAAGCPSCLLYVLITKNNPKCPRCNMIVPSPMPLKKPRIDLNISI